MQNSCKAAAGGGSTTTRCNTRYPIVPVHGTGFRDTPFLQYRGRIPKRLQAEGAVIFYGGQGGRGSIESNAALLSAKLSELLAETGCGKVNIITHSKGGLDARYIIAALGRAGGCAQPHNRVAPHHGSRTMDKRMRLPRWLFRAAAVINTLFGLMGDKHPDFHKACGQFTTTYMAAFNKRVPQAGGVYCQSYAFAMAGAQSDWLMCLPHLMVKTVEGGNDGLVAVSRARYGVFRGVLRSGKRRGISHLNTVDMRRRPLHKKRGESGHSGTEVWDVAETHVQIVEDLKLNGRWCTGKTTRRLACGQAEYTPQWAALFHPELRRIFAASATGAYPLGTRLFCRVPRPSIGICTGCSACWRAFTSSA